MGKVFVVNLKDPAWPTVLPLSESIESPDFYPIDSNQLNTVRGGRAGRRTHRAHVLAPPLAHLPPPLLLPPLLQDDLQAIADKMGYKDIFAAVADKAL